MSRLVQAANRHNGVMRRRMAQLAERVANGMAIHHAGAAVGLTRGETARAWSRIKLEMGEQAQ